MINVLFVVHAATVNIKCYIEAAYFSMVSIGIVGGSVIGLATAEAILEDHPGAKASESFFLN